MADLIGQRIGNYEIISVLGKGGMAVVYRAHQLNIQRDVAIKVIKPDLSEADDLIKRFEREANMVASLSHPHILKLFDFGQFEEMLYLVMELMTGGTLADALHKKPLSPERAARLLDQMADALDFAHAQGLIHRDLKPQNILLDEQGNSHLTDFGIAKILTENTVFTQTGVAIGTPAYMPPEQWQGLALDARADVYALGVMLYEMLTGTLPFTAETPASLMYRHLQEKPPSINAAQSGLPWGVDQVIQTALAKAPEDRFASTGEMANAFRRAIEDTGENPVDPNAETEAATYIGGVQQPQTLPARTKQANSRAPQLAIVGGILLVLILGGFLVTRLVSGATPATPTIAATLPATRVVVAVSSSTASATSAPTKTPLPPSATAIPTLDATVAAQRTSAAVATINAARTQLFIEGQTATAINWTATPSKTATFTPSPTVPSLTPSLTFTPTVPTPTPLPPTPTVTTTSVLTLDATAVAQSTDAAVATINAARTQLFIDDQTATAKQWTATPSKTATFTPSPTVPNFTPSATFTPTLIPTPAIPVWDDFSSQAAEASKWDTNANQITAEKIVNGSLKLQTSGWMILGMRSAAHVRVIAALVTLQDAGGFFMQLGGSSSYRISISCYSVGIRKMPYSDPANDRYSNPNVLPVSGCPTTHLLSISFDGMLAHFYVDGTEISASNMAGDSTGASIGPDGTGVVFVHKVWVEFAK